MCKRINVVIPKKFLWRYPLELGAKSVGIVMICIMLIIAIATAIQIVAVKDCNDCPYFSWRNCFAYSITAFFYAVSMLLLNIWFLWGIYKEKSSVVLSWIVVTSTWLLQTFCLLIVLICMYCSDTNLISWILSLVFGLIAIGLLIYGILVVVGLWLDLKGQRSTPEAA